MRAIVVTEDGVVLQDIAEPPPPGPGEILVRVRAAALNRADLLVARGRAHGRIGGPGTIVGLEFAGEIAAVGDGVPTTFAVGDRVMCSAARGWADYALADYGRCMKIPDANMGFEEASTLPVAVQTMHDALVTNGGLARGESVLIQGASSGVGLMGLQIARAMGAGLVAGSSTNAERRARLGNFGCDLAIDSRDPTWAQQILDATGGKGVDLIVDQISGYVANDNLRAAAITGRVVNVGRLGGFHGDFDFDLHALRRIRYVGVTFRTRSPEEVRAITDAAMRDLGPALAARDLSLPIDRTYPMEDAADALDRMEANAHFGKIVLTF